MIKDSYFVVNISIFLILFALTTAPIRCRGFPHHYSTPSSSSPTTKPIGSTTTTSSRRDWIQLISSVTAGISSSSMIMSSNANNNAAVAAVDETNGGEIAASPKNVIRWGIVGLGDVTKVKSGPPFYKCENSELVAVMRRSPGKAKEFATTVPGGKCVGYDNLDDFLRHPDLDAVYVSTRPGTHYEICQAVANAGLACYVEKPVGRCSEETKQIVQLFESKQLPLYTAYISRAYTRTQTLRSLLFEEQVIGNTMKSISYELIGTGGARDMDVAKGDLPWRLQVQQSGGGLILDVGCHIIDRIEYIANNSPLINIKGTAENRNSLHYQDVEDYVSLQATIGPPLLKSSSTVKCEGAKVTCTWDFAPKDGGQESKDEFIIRGPKGILKMVGMSPNGPIQLLDAQDESLIKEYTFDMPQHTAQQMIQAVTNDLLVKSGRSSSTSSATDAVLSYGDNAIRTQQVIDACLSSYYGGREIGYWDRPPESWPGLDQRVK